MIFEYVTLINVEFFVTDAISLFVLDLIDEKFSVMILPLRAREARILIGKL